MSSNYEYAINDDQQEEEVLQDPRQKWRFRLMLGAAMIVAFLLGVVMSAFTSGRTVSAEIWKDMMAQTAPEPSPAPTPEPTPIPTPVVEIEAADAFDAQALEELEAFAKKQPGHISIWLCDLSTGESYYHNEGGFYCASTLKAPYALWLCLRDEAGEIDLDMQLEDSSGWELIYEMISRSSNNATHILSEQWPATQETGFVDFVRQLGFGSPEGCEVVPEGIHGWMTSRDGGRAMLAVYNYILTGSNNSLNLENAFLAANHNILWYPGVASKKYGSWDNAFHDMAIVYGEKPYIIAAFSNWATKENGMPEKAVERMQTIGHLAAAAVGAPTE